MPDWNVYAIAHSLAAATVLLAVLAMRCVSSERVRGQLLGRASRMTLWVITPIAMIVSTLAWEMPFSQPNAFIVWLNDMVIVWVAYLASAALSPSRRINEAKRTQRE